MAGCLTTSINSIFLPNDILPGDDLIGKWKVNDDSLFQNYLLISKSEDNRLLLKYIQHNVESGKLIEIDTVDYIGNLGRIHGVLFLEFKPYPNDLFYPGMMIPTYHFVRVSLQQNKMTWYAIPPKKLNNYIKHKEFSIQASFQEDTESMLITDNTKNIQEFLKAALLKKELFEQSSEYSKVE